VAWLYDMLVAIEHEVSSLPSNELPFLGSTPLKLLQACDAAARNAAGLTGGVAVLNDNALGRSQTQESAPLDLARR